MSTNEPMTREQLEAIQARVDAATEGPWVWLGEAELASPTIPDPEDEDDYQYITNEDGQIDSSDDADLIEHAPDDLADLLAEVERLRARAALADAMIERVARDTAAKESFTSRRPWEGLSHDERTYRRAQAHRILAADLGTVLNN